MTISANVIPVQRRIRCRTPPTDAARRSEMKVGCASPSTGRESSHRVHFGMAQRHLHDHGGKQAALRAEINRLERTPRPLGGRLKFAGRSRRSTALPRSRRSIHWQLPRTRVPRSREARSPSN